MSDISTIWQATRGDWALKGADLRSGNDLLTAVTISLFTDREALEDDAQIDPRGWWGDEGQYLIGSRIWLIERAKRTQETLSRAQAYIEEALQWLIDDGVVATFGIYVEWTARHMLGARVIASRTDGTTTAMNFSWVWTGIN